MVTGFEHTSAQTVVIPLLGSVDPGAASLPVLTVVLAALDSFNPCAFFVLLFLLSLLIHSGSRARMLTIGGTFIFFSGLVYYIFLAAWLSVFMVLGALPAVTVAAGIIAVGVSLINIKDFFFFKRGFSLTISEEAKPKLFERMRGLLKSVSITSAVFGTAVLAAAANSYELLCTAGFPMVFTRALTLHRITPLGYYLYLLLYDVIYVLPMGAIMVTFVMTLGSHRLTEWHGRQLKLVSGMMMLMLGLVLLIDPPLLTDGLVSGVVMAAAIAVAGLVIFISRKLCPDIVHHGELHGPFHHDGPQ